MLLPDTEARMAPKLPWVLFYLSSHTPGTFFSIRFAGVPGKFAQKTVLSPKRLDTCEASV